MRQYALRSRVVALGVVYADGNDRILDRTTEEATATVLIDFIARLSTLYVA